MRIYMHVNTDRYIKYHAYLLKNQFTPNTLRAKYKYMFTSKLPVC